VGQQIYNLKQESSISGFHTGPLLMSILFLVDNTSRCMPYWRRFGHQYSLW